MFKKNVAIYGKHSQYVDELTNNKFFHRAIDAYINAAVVGFRYNRKSTRDKSAAYKDAKTTIFAEQMIKESPTIEFIYRLILLLENCTNDSLEDRINRAFRDDSLEDVSDRHKENMEVFNSYILGGIEILYEKLLETGATQEDYMKNAYNFIKDQELTFNKLKADDLIDSL